LCSNNILGNDDVSGGLTRTFWLHKMLSWNVRTTVFFTARLRCYGNIVG
jgi:hypothetical protein